MRLRLFFAVLAWCVALENAHANGSVIEDSKYAAVWRSAVPDAFKPDSADWRRDRDPDDVIKDAAIPIETFYIHDHSRSCGLYDVAPSRLLTTCAAEDGSSVIGLYDAGSQRKMDEIVLRGEVERAFAHPEHLSSAKGWDVRVETSAGRLANTTRTATFFAIRNDKLVRIASFVVGDEHLDMQESEGALDVTKNLWGTAISKQIRALHAEWPGYNAEYVETVWTAPVDEDGDGFRERIDNTTHCMVRTTHGGHLAINLPAVTRTLRWSPKTHTYEE